MAEFHLSKKLREGLNVLVDIKRPFSLYVFVQNVQISNSKLNCGKKFNLF